jgi:shikimate kinase
MILKLKRTPGIYLVGFMACGKSTVGRILAEEIGWHFGDLDQDIEFHHKMTIPDIFDQLGEAAFREMESAAIATRVRSIERGRPTVLALGGGAFTHEKNCSLLTGNGVTIWIDCSLAIIRDRVAHSSHRPLARDTEAMERLYEERRQAYERAEYRVETFGDSAAVVKDILKLPIF